MLMTQKTWYSNKITIGTQHHVIFKKNIITCFSMKKKCCHVRMLSSNKSCSIDNLDQVIDAQQYNSPLIHQQLRESKIQAVVHINYLLPLKGHEENSQSCLKLLCNIMRD